MTNLEKKYLISLKESDQVAAGPELEKAAELKNEATLEKEPSELTSTINNNNVYGNDEEVAEDVGEVVVESLYSFLAECSEEELASVMTIFTESELELCECLVESVILNEGVFGLKAKKALERGKEFLKKHGERSWSSSWRRCWYGIGT